MSREEAWEMPATEMQRPRGPMGASQLQVWRYGCRVAEYREARGQEQAGGRSASEVQGARLDRGAPPPAEEPGEVTVEQAAGMTVSERQHAVLMGRADSTRSAAVRRRRQAFLSR